MSAATTLKKNMAHTKNLPKSNTNAAITEEMPYKRLSPSCDAQLAKTAHNYSLSDVVIGLISVQIYCHRFLFEMMLVV